MGYREQFEALRGEPYIRAVNLVGMREYLAECGCDMPALMDEVGIPRKALEDLDMLISFRAAAVLLELASNRHGIPHLGMILSRRADPEYTLLGPSILMANFVRTVREWSDLALRYWQFHTNGFKLELIEPGQGETATLRVHFQALAFPARQFVESTAANIVGLFRVITAKPDENPALVRFQHRAPPEQSFHREIFGCPIEFGCDHAEIIFDRKFLDYETRGGMRLMKPMMQLYISERIRRMKLFDHTLAATVALAITSLLGSGHCNQEAVADSLQIHPKAMKRQLAKEGTTFTELLENVRQRIARQLLVETDAAVMQIAGLLDYAAPGPFIVAFGRWEGMPPLQYRKQQRQVIRSAVEGSQAAAPLR